MAQKTPRGGLRGVGMVLQARDARDARGAASFFALGPRPQEFVVKELLSGGPAADCRTISCGDCIAEIDGTRVEGRTLQQVQNLIRGPPSTSVTIRLTRGHGRDRRDYTVSLARGDCSSRNSCRDGEERDGCSDAPAAPAPGPVGARQAQDWSPGSPRRSETGEPDLQECHAFWAEMRQQLGHLRSLAKGGEWPIAGWRAPAWPKGACMADSASCLRELRKYPVDDADTGSMLRLELIEDMVFLRDQVRCARGELMESVFAKNAVEPGNVLVSIDASAATPMLPAPSPEDPRKGGCGRCERLFAHLQNVDAQRAQLHTATVRHRIRVGAWEQKRLKAASEMWLQAAHLGASLEHIALELAEIRESFDQDAPIHFFSSVLLGQKSLFHGDGKLDRNTTRASWNAGSPGRIRVSGRDGTEVARRSLPVNIVSAANSRPNKSRAGRELTLGALCEEAAEVTSPDKGAHKQALNASGQVQLLTRQVKELQEQLAASHANAAAPAAPSENVRKLQRENEALKKELLVITDLEKKVEEQEAQWASDVATMAEKLAKKSEEVDKEKIALKKALEAQKSKCGDILKLKEKLTSAVQLENNAKSRNLVLELELTSFKEKLTEKTKHVQGLNTRIESMDTDLRNARERVAVLDKLLQDMAVAAQADQKQAHDRYADEIEAKQTVIETLKIDLSSTKDELQLLRDELSVATAAADSQHEKMRAAEQKLLEQGAEHAKELQRFAQSDYWKEERIKQLEHDLTEAKQEKEEARIVGVSLEDTLRKRTLELNQSQLEQEAAREEIKTLRESIACVQKQLETTQQMGEDERKQKETNAERIKEMEEEVSKYVVKGIDRDALQHMWQQYKDMYEEEHRAKVLLQHRAVEAIRGVREAHTTETMLLKATIEGTAQEVEDLMVAFTDDRQQQAQVLAFNLEQHQENVAKAYIAEENLKIHLAHLQAELDMLQDERVELIATSHKYQDEASAFQEEADNLKEMYGRLEASSSRAIAELESKIKDQDGQWGKDVSVLKEKLKVARYEVHQLNVALQNAEARANSSENSLAHSTDEAQAHKKSIMVLECAIKDIEGHRNEIRDSYRKAESVIGKLQAEKDTLTKSHSLLERDLSMISSEKEVLLSKLATAEGQIAEISAMVSEYQKTLAAKDESLAEANNDNSQLRQQITHGQKELEVALSNMQQAHAEMHARERAHQSQMNDLVREQEERCKVQIEAVQERHGAFLVELGAKHAAEIRDEEAKHAIALRQVESEQEKIDAKAAANLSAVEVQHAAILRENEEKHALQLKEVEEECHVKLDAMRSETQREMRLCKRDWENMKDKCLQEAEQKRRQEVESLKQASAEEVDRIKVQWAQEVNELRQIHQQLEENARCLSQENDELKQTIEKSKLSLRGQWEHFEVDKEAKQARCEIEALKLSIQSLQEEADKSRSQCTQMQQELDRSTSRNQELDELARILKQEQEALKDELREAEKQVIEITALYQSTRCEVERQASVIAKLKVGLDTFQQQLQKQVTNIEETSSQIQAQLYAVQSCQQADAHAVKLETDAIAMACERADLKRRLQGQKFQDSISQLKEMKQTQIACIMRQIDDVGNDVQSALAAHSSLDVQHSALQQVFASREKVLESKVVALEIEHRDQVAKHDKMMIEKGAEHAANLKQSDERLAQLTASKVEEREALERQIKALCDEQSSYVSDLQKRDDIIAELRKNLSVVAEQLDTREAELRAVSEEYKVRETKHEQEMQAALDQNDCQRIEIRDLRLQRGDMQAHSQDVLAERDILKTELDELRATVVNLNQRMAEQERIHGIECKELGQRCWTTDLERDGIRGELQACKLQLDTCQRELIRCKAELKVAEDAAEKTSRDIATLKDSEEMLTKNLLAAQSKFNEQAVELRNMQHESVMNDHDVKDCEACVRLKQTLHSVESQLSAQLDQSRVMAMERETMEQLLQKSKTDLDHKSDKRSSFGNVRGVFSEEQDKKLRELERSLTRLISENSDYRRSQSRLQWELAALEKLFTIFQHKHQHFVLWSHCHMSLLYWRYVRCSSSDDAVGTPCSARGQASGSQVCESTPVIQGSDTDTASCESVQTAQSYFTQYSNLYVDDGMREKAHRFQQHVATLRAKQLTMNGMVAVRIRLRFMSTVLVNWRLHMMSRLHFLVVTRSVVERRRAKVKRIALGALADERLYKAKQLKAAAALEMLTPRIRVVQHLRIWLQEVERSARHRMIMMQMGVRWTKVSIKGAISCLRRHKALSREIRKFKKNLINSKLLAIVQAWWLHSRTQTVGAKFLRAGEKSVNRVTGAAVNVTGVAVSAISYVNPANVLGAWSSPFSSPAPGPNVNVAGRRGSIRSGRESEEGNSQPDSTARCLARNLPHTARSGPDYEGVSDSQDDAREAEPAVGQIRGTPGGVAPTAEQTLTGFRAASNVQPDFFSP